MKRVLFGVGYLVMGGFCAVGLVQILTGADRPDVDRATVAAIPIMILLISTAGLVVLVVAPWIQRRRPGPVLTVAPSGRPATAFPRSPFYLVLHVTFISVGVGWLVAVAIMLVRHGEPVWAATAAAVALGGLWMVVRVAIGRVRPGGLWLTPSGLEYRKDALVWSVPWSDVTGVREAPEAVSAQADVRELLLPAEPVMVRLGPGATHRMAGPRWAQRLSPPGSLRIDSYHLAGGGRLIVEMIGECLNYPRVREQLGTAHSLPRQAHSLPRRSR